MFLFGIAFLLAALTFPASAARAQEDGGDFQTVADAKTSVKIGLPLALFAEPTATRWGSNWIARDKSINVDTLVYGEDKTLKKLYGNLLGVKGRRLTRNEFLTDRFILAGEDSGGGGFYVEMRERAGAIRGLSIVYNARNRQAREALALRIAGSFEPFPGGSETIVAGGANPPAGRPAPAPSGACREEDQRLGAAVAGVRMEITGADRRILAEPIAIRLTGLRSVTAAASKDLKIVSAFSGSVLVEGGGQGFEILAPGAVSEADGRSYGVDRKRVVYAWTDLDASDAAELIVSSNRMGPVEVSSAIVAKTVCGERPVGPVVKRGIDFTADPREVELAAMPGDRCVNEAALLKRLASQITVRAENAASVRAGDAIEIAWTRGAERFPAGLPAQLVVTTPEWARFQGGHILPLPPGARAPQQIAYGAGQTRAFIPLTARATPEAGKFRIKAQRSGRFPIGYAVAAKTSCGEQILAQGDVGEFEVEPGQPDVVIQDLFSVDQPDSIAIANNGRYRLEVFKASYRVFDLATGNKIVDRAGRDANFSPAARFVAAYVEGSGNTGGRLEIVDLISGRPVPDLAPHGPILGWALGDALLIEGTMGHPELRIRRTLADLEFVEPFANEPGRREEAWLAQASTSGRGDTAWERYRLQVFADQGIAVVEDFFDGDSGPERLSTSVFELASGHKRGAYDAPRLGGVYVDQWGNLDKTPSPGDVRDLLATYGIRDYQSRAGWSAGEPLTLSHYSASTDERLAELAAKGEIKSAPPAQRTFLVEHHGKALAQAAADAPAMGAASRAVDWRSRGLTRKVAAYDAFDRARFSEQLARFGICPQADCSQDPVIAAPRALAEHSEFAQSNFQYASQSTTFAEPAAALEKALINDVPAARKLLSGEPNKVCYQGEVPDDAAPEERVKFRIAADGQGRTDVLGLWKWKTGNTAYWLAQTVCSHAGVLGSAVTLFAGAPGTQGKIYVLSQGDAGSDNGEGLHKNFQGTPDEAMMRISPIVVENRWLLIAAPAGNSAAVIDLQKPDSPAYIYNLADVYAVAHLFRSADGAHLIQLNTDGRFYIHRINTGEFVISGRWIDDEIVLVTANGYYDGSYEGAHFAHLTFAGEPDFYSLAQFEKNLRRPDIVASVIKGAVKDGPKPALSVPPHVLLNVSLEPGGGSQSGVKLAARSRRGLKTVRMFDDGMFVQQIALRSREAELDVALNRPPMGRWLSAVAEDSAGFLSAPSVAVNPAPSANDRKLYAVVAGVDRYREERLNLAYARSDARRLAAALRHPRGGYYASVEAVELLDESATSEAIVSALERAVASARPGDTVLFSFAGHGLQGEDNRYYLTSSSFLTSDVSHTAVGWAKIAETVSKAKSRVIIVLDSCFSGSTGKEGIAANDRAAAELLKGARAPVLVLAASKGRQYSYEDEKGAPSHWGGGVFTGGLVKVLADDWRNYDANGNGALEISELYGAVKAFVVRETKGGQTPWLVRQDLVGDFALF